MNTTGSSRAPAGTAASRCLGPEGAIFQPHPPAQLRCRRRPRAWPGRAGRARRPRRDGARGRRPGKPRHRRRRGAKSPSRSPEPAPRTPCPQRGGGGGCGRGGRRRRAAGRERTTSGRRRGGGGGSPLPPPRGPPAPRRPPPGRRPGEARGALSACARGTASGARRAPGSSRPRCGHLTGIRAWRRFCSWPSIPALRPGSRTRRTGPARGEDIMAARARRWERPPREPPARDLDPLLAQRGAGEMPPPGARHREVLRRSSKVPASRFSERVASACGSW